MTIPLVDIIYPKKERTVRSGKQHYISGLVPPFHDNYGMKMTGIYDRGSFDRGLCYIPLHFRTDFLCYFNSVSVFSEIIYGYLSEAFFISIAESLVSLQPID